MDRPTLLHLKSTIMIWPCVITSGNKRRVILIPHCYTCVLKLYLVDLLTTYAYYKDKKHLKNVGPIRYCEPPLHCQSPGVASRMPAIAIAQAACDVHDIDDDNDDNDNDNA